MVAERLTVAVTVPHGRTPKNVGPVTVMVGGGGRARPTTCWQPGMHMPGGARPIWTRAHNAWAALTPAAANAAAVAAAWAPGGNARKGTLAVPVPVQVTARPGEGHLMGAACKKMRKPTARTVVP